MTGRFEMGSTIVLIFEASQDTQLNVHEGKRVLLGDKIVCQK
jgi:phosphatidylserine decarboxylase